MSISLHTLWRYNYMSISLHTLLRYDYMSISLFQFLFINILYFLPSITYTNLSVLC